MMKEYEFKLTPEGKKFYQNMKTLKDNEVAIGFQRGKAMHQPKDGQGAAVDMVDIAAFNELGTSTSPARPFLRMSIEENRDKIKAFIAKKTQEIIKGKSADQALQELGVFGVGLVQEKIASGSFVPNAPSTLRRKSSDRPLIDTGQMRQSVHYVTKRKGEE